MASANIIRGPSAIFFTLYCNIALDNNVNNTSYCNIAVDNIANNTS